MHSSLSCLCCKYRQGQHTVSGLGRRDIQFNNESQTKRSRWTHGESVQVTDFLPLVPRGTITGLDPIWANLILQKQLNKPAMPKQVHNIKMLKQPKLIDEIKVSQEP